VKTISNENFKGNVKIAGKNSKLVFLSVLYNIRLYYYFIQIFGILG